jgi:hypothetical protein
MISCICRMIGRSGRERYRPEVRSRLARGSAYHRSFSALLHGTDAIDRRAEGAAVVYLIVGLDRGTLARWHGNVAAPDVTEATRIAKARAAAQGVRLVVAAAIGPYSSIADDVGGASLPDAA